ncbi:hypothetical protein SK128_013889 [Halocaridina rubra]|uniref:Uncharacterized protein n=1 Tax=Halocaridina rubra TaxID=373956 RepID=A0AAN9ACL0_HALRR
MYLDTQRTRELPDLPFLILFEFGFIPHNQGCNKKNYNNNSNKHLTLKEEPSLSTEIIRIQM